MKVSDRWPLVVCVIAWSLLSVAGWCMTDEDSVKRQLTDKYDKLVDLKKFNYEEYLKIAAAIVASKVTAGGSLELYIATLKAEIATRLSTSLSTQDILSMLKGGARTIKGQHVQIGFAEIRIWTEEKYPRISLTKGLSWGEVRVYRPSHFLLYLGIGKKGSWQHDGQAVSVKAPPPPSPAKTLQSNWRSCFKCKGLFYEPGRAKSRCPRGGQHTHTQGDAKSGIYTLVINDTKNQQRGWEWCTKCQGIFYEPNEGRSKCPSGGTHRQLRFGGRIDGNSYTLFLSNHLPAGSEGRSRQDGWKHCTKCQGLFHGPSQSQSRCPAGGTHELDRGDVGRTLFHRRP